MAKYQHEKSDLAKSRFFDIFGDLSEEEQLNLLDSLSKIEHEARL